MWKPGVATRQWTFVVVDECFARQLEVGMLTTRPSDNGNSELRADIFVTPFGLTHQMSDSAWRIAWVILVMVQYVYGSKTFSYFQAASITCLCTNVNTHAPRLENWSCAKTGTTFGTLRNSCIKVKVSCKMYREMLRSILLMFAVRIS
jgi:hypothetical protein